MRDWEWIISSYLLWSWKWGREQPVSSCSVFQRWWTLVNPALLPKSEPGVPPEPAPKPCPDPDFSGEWGKRGTGENPRGPGGGEQVGYTASCRSPRARSAGANESFLSISDEADIVLSFTRSHFQCGDESALFLSESLRNGKLQRHTCIT